MSRSRPAPASRAACLVLACTFGCAPAAATPSAPDAQPPVLQSELVSTGLYLIRGGGANSLLRMSPAGLIVVDAKSPGNYRLLMSQVRRIAKLGDLPVRALLLTGDDPAHAGNAAAFEGAGVRIVARDDVLRRLALPAADAARPVPAPVSFEREYRLRLGGVEARLVSLGDGAEAGGTVVLFPDLRVVAIGELLPANPPQAAGQASLLRWSASLADLLKLDFDRAVPARGGVVARSDIEALSARLDALVAHAQALATQGDGIDAMVSQLQADGPGRELGATREQIERLRAELPAAR